MKGSVYMTIPNYMTISGKAEYLEITHGSNFDDQYIVLNQKRAHPHNLPKVHDTLYGLLSRTLICTACDTCLDL
jgi:hypothetical protein